MIDMWGEMNAALEQMDDRLREEIASDIMRRILALSCCIFALIIALIFPTMTGAVALVALAIIYLGYAIWLRRRTDLGRRALGEDKS